CHGDLHLNNVILLEGKPLLFDCIEFNPSLRIIDVISEIAFLVMDLEEHSQLQHANLLLNQYLEQSGDYHAIPLLKFYLCYRAMVRAKVALLRLDQNGIEISERDKIYHEFENYLMMAERYSEPPTSHAAAQIIITHGLSGSGKTTLTTPLMQQLGAIRIRSDIERKRLFGLTAEANSDDLNIYTHEASRRTYQRLIELSTAIIKGGYPVIVDATFLKRSERDHYRDLAQELDVPFTILVFEAPFETLKQRVTQRTIAGDDASEADVDVLLNQQDNYQPLDADELKTAIVIDTTSAGTVELTLSKLQANLENFD
ncbi:MAG: AAA family ATPase, partial [Gammaproteobacteria bacterium]|nr:AAA family ATPase [Gammaproteobacteria bacterium]